MEGIRYQRMLKTNLQVVLTMEDLDLGLPKWRLLDGVMRIRQLSLMTRNIWVLCVWKDGNGLDKRCFPLVGKTPIPVELIVQRKFCTKN